VVGDAINPERVRWRPGAAGRPAGRAQPPAGTGALHRVRRAQRGALLALVLACVAGAVCVDVFLLPGLPTVWIYAAAVLLAAGWLPAGLVAATSALTVAAQAASLAWDRAPPAALVFESAGLAILAGLAVALARHRQTLRARTAEAEAAVRARDELLAIASHELRAPLAVLCGYAGLLVHRLDARSAADLDLDGLRQGARAIELGVQRLARLVEQLLDLSRLDAGKLVLELAPTDLAALVETAAEHARGLAPGYAIVVRRPPALLAQVDALRLEQVVSNLIGNAIKYSPAGGPIEVELAPLPAPPGVSPTARLAVRDHGAGIPADLRDRVFDRFAQAHGAGHLGGLGLGLYVSRQIVELHGGRIDAECPDGGGTCFTITLPTALPPDSAGTSAPVPAPPSAPATR
jgi:signal transduction histidine kinase